MMKRSVRNSLFIIAGAIVAVALVSIFPKGAAFAATSYSKEYNKAIAQGFVTCTASLKKNVSMSDYDLAKKSKSFLSSNPDVKVPNYTTGTIIKATDGGTMKCSELIDAVINQNGGWPNETDEQGVANLITSLGYEPKGVTENNRRARYTYTYHKSSIMLPGADTGTGTFEISVAIDSGGNLTSNPKIEGVKSTIGLTVTNVSNYKIDSNSVRGCTKISYVSTSYSAENCAWYTTSYNAVADSPAGNYYNFSQYFEGVESALKESVKGSNATNSNYYVDLDSITKTEINDYVIAENYARDISDSKLNTVIGNLFGLSGDTVADKLTFPNPATFALYQNYLVDHYGAEIVCPTTDDEKKTYEDDKDFKKISYYNGSEVKADCYAKQTKKGAVNGITDGKRFPTIKPLTFNDVTSWLAGHSGVDPEKLAKYTILTVAGLSSTSACMDNAESLGWILCPILGGLSDATDWIYDQVIQDFLQIDATMFSDSSNGVYATWQTFQTFANIVFVIMLLVVIISQLTGVGIDNYGIKKILPRLIISALLINFSYIICQLAVDASNIIGVSLNNLFNNLAGNIPLSITSEGSNAVGNIASIITIAIGAATAAIAALSIGPGLVITLLLGVLTAFISILFVFILLGVRQAVVVILTAVSPLVFVLYMLPNTKTYFDKAIKIFSQMLLLFPICGLLIGGGNFASRLLLSTNSDSFLFDLAAMLVSVVPFFFIPTILKSSFTALGNLGTTVANLTRRAGQTVNKGAKNTRTYQTMMARSKAGYNMFTGKEGAGIRRRIANRGGIIGRYVSRNMNIGQSAIDKFEAEQAEADAAAKNPAAREAIRAARRSETEAKYKAASRPGWLEARTVGLQDEERRKANKDAALLMEQQFVNPDGTRMNDNDAMNFITSRLDSGNRDEAAAAMIAGSHKFGDDFGNRLAGWLHQKDQNGEAISGSTMTAMREYMNENSGFASSMKNKNFDAFAMISSGGVLKNGSEGSLSDFRAQEASGMKDSDWASQKGATLRRAIADGTLSQERIQQIMASDDPSIKSGIMSEPEKRDLFQATTYNAQQAASGAAGPTLPTNMAAQRYREAQQRSAEQQVLHVQHEEDAARIGQTTLNDLATGTSFKGYATPSGFNSVGSPTRNADGHYIYTSDDGRKWNATTGRYVRPPKPTP